MARPKKEDAQGDLHPYEQLGKIMDCGEQYRYRFKSGETCELSQTEAVLIKAKLDALKANERGDVVLEMMNDFKGFTRAMCYLEIDLNAPECFVDLDDEDQYTLVFHWKKI